MLIAIEDGPDRYATVFRALRHGGINEGYRHAGRRNHLDVAGMDALFSKVSHQSPEVLWLGLVARAEDDDGRTGLNRAARGPREIGARHATAHSLLEFALIR
jgi:hypothetical protein